MTAPAPEDVHAAGVLARHLTGRLAAGIDPDHVGAALVALLRQHGWRPIPRPPQIASDRPKDHAAYDRGREKWRQAWANRPTGPYRPETQGDTDA